MANMTPLTLICDANAQHDPDLYIVHIEVPDWLTVPGAFGLNILDETFDFDINPLRSYI